MKILVVEDDPRLGTLLGRGLRRSGHVAEIAPTLEEAGWHLSEARFDVVVLDVMLPDGDGFDFCRDLRAASNPVPVLMLTARDSVRDRVRGLDVGADDYLVKPFAFAELEARIRALDRRGPSGKTTLITAGDLTIDPAAHRATLASGELDLAGRQFSLLEFFARRADEVLSRAVIIEQVWDWAFEGDPRIIDVYVGVLRRKLAANPGGPWIQTVRGSGYALRTVPRPPSKPAP